jgi:outer membrane lipoprotein-sorting protein
LVPNNKKIKMKNLKLGLIAIAALFSATAIHAQTADEIVAKYVDAIGGKEKLKAINSVRMENTLNIMGNEAPNTTTILNGKGYRNESEFNGAKIIQVITDKGGWMVNPMAGATDPQALPDDQVKAGKSQIFVVPLLDYSTKGAKAELLGQEKVGTVNAYKVKITDADNVPTTYYFDPTTYYLLQITRSSEMMGQQMDVTATYSDYKKTDYGWVVPQNVEINMGGQFSMTLKLKNVEVNKDVDPKIFDMPAK